MNRTYIREHIAGTQPVSPKGLLNWAFEQLNMPNAEIIRLVDKVLAEDCQPYDENTYCLKQQ